MTRTMEPIAGADAPQHARQIGTQASLLALDWGTSSLRAYLLDAAGQTIAMRQEPWGLMQVPTVTKRQGADAFDAAFDMILRTWPDLPASVPVIAAGMVGSAQGWQEVPYEAVPCGLEVLGHKLLPVRTSSGREVWIVPGLREPGALPNVMRGEETQIVGALQVLRQALQKTLPQVPEPHAPLFKSPNERTLLGLPGSHSKWALLEKDAQGKDVLVHFDTFMTGEAFSALGNHTILARTSRPAANDEAAFTRGVVTALSPTSKGVLATIFSCRTLSLSGELTPEQQSDYLSGLLIGAEIAGMRDVLTGNPSQPLQIALIGDPDLCRRYLLALRLAGVTDTVPVIEQATQAGLWQLAGVAGLVAAR